MKGMNKHELEMFCELMRENAELRQMVKELLSELIRLKTIEDEEE